MPQKNNIPLRSSGLSRGGLAHWLAHFETNKVWLVVPEVSMLEPLAVNLRFWLKQNKQDTSVLIFPEDDPRTFDGASPSPSFSQQRARVLHNVFQELPTFIVSTPLAALSCTIQSEDFLRAYIALETEQEYSLPRLLRKLSHIGYLHVDIVEEEGFYSHKGDSLNIWPLGSTHPYLISFFGDELENIYRISPTTHQHLEKIQELRLPPTRELPLRLSAIRRAEKHTQEQVNSHNLSQNLRNRVIRDLKNGIWFPGAEAYVAACYELQPIISLFPNIVLYEETESEVLLRNWAEKLPRRWENLGTADQPPIDPKKRFLSSKEIDSVLESSHRAGDVLANGEPQDLMSTVDFSLKKNGITAWCRRLRILLDSGFVITLVARQQHLIDRLEELLSANELPYHNQKKYYPNRSNSIALIQNELNNGFFSNRLQSLVLTAQDIFGTAKSPNKKQKRKSLHNVSRQTFLSLKVGDYIVHQDHGIGRYQGVEQVKVKGVFLDYVKLLYRNEEELLLPANYLEKIQLYRSAGGAPLKLDKIGSTSWSKRKAKIKEKALAFAHELLRKQANRQQRDGWCYSGHSKLLENIENDFPFEATSDQRNAIEDLLDLMGQDKPCDFLLVGDVGFGKTEVAIRAIATVVAEGHQVLFLCPTTVLALQHQRTLSSRFKKYGISVGMLSRLVDPKQNRQIKKDFANGELSILIGTQSLLSRTLKGQHIGLVIVDEEHRFGVQQKEKIRNFAQNQEYPAEYVAMSATPIPRTLHMALSGLRDVSVIASPPYGRRPVRTLCFKKSPAQTRQQIQHELERGGQVFYIHNRIKGLAEITHHIQELVPHAIVRSAHGRMDRKILEQTLVDFMERRFHVLVCTSIIENGIDLPNVNTIIIDNAHLMGLSQLYQLRGRVGRSHQQGYCSFLIPEKITKEAMNRIATLQRYTELGSGFSIAAADLELRGSGNLLGREQSGHIQSVGLDTYLDILSQVVNELSQKPTISIDADIDIPESGRIPEDYIAHPDERLQFHRVLATAEFIHETRQLLDKWEHEYGPVPQEARQLVWYTESRIWCAQLGIRILHWLKKRVHLQFDTRVSLDEPRISMIARRYPERMSVKVDGDIVDVYVRFESAEAEHPFHFLLWIFQTFKPNSDSV